MTIFKLSFIFYGRIILVLHTEDSDGILLVYYVSYPFINVFKNVLIFLCIKKLGVIVCLVITNTTPRIPVNL